MKNAPADEKSSGGPPYLLFAALVAVGASVAFPVMLLVDARVTEQPRGALVADAATALVAADAGPAVAVAEAAATTPPARDGDDAGVVAPASASASTATSAAANGDAGAKPAASAKPEASADPNAPGFLTIHSTPTGRVSERGRVLCTTTPCQKLKLPPGPHTITIENKDEAVQAKIVVTIVSGETAARRVTLK